MIRLGSAITEGGAGLVDGSKGVVAENAVYVWESAIVVEAGLDWATEKHCGERGSDGFGLRSAGAL
jgi:hypothetical protein